MSLMEVGVYLNAGIYSLLYLENYTTLSVLTRDDAFKY